MAKTDDIQNNKKNLRKRILMKETEKGSQVFIEIGPSNSPYAKIILPQKRSGPKDRRKLHTYIADDRRSGIANRRKLQ
jgi:hypothetical protein